MTDQEIATKNAADEGGRMAHVTREKSAEAFGRSLASTALSQADLIRLEPMAWGNLAHGVGVTEFGLDAHAAAIIAALGNPPFQTRDEARAFLAGVGEVKAAVSNGYHEARP